MKAQENVYLQTLHKRNYCYSYGWYRTKRPIHCDHLFYCALPI
jgi:hypothetical protein